MIAAARRDMGLDPEQFARAAAEDVGKSSVDILTSEVLPLLAAMRFLERSAEGILRPRRLGRKGLPLWLTGVDSEVQRVPFGTMLVIGPSNYPLMLAGIQAVQALVAGNTVVWKPGRGGRSIAEALAKVLKRAGLPDGLLRVTDESVAAAERELAGDVDKVFFTGSVPSGRAVLRQAAGAGDSVRRGTFRVRCLDCSARSGSVACGAGTYVWDAAEWIVDMHGSAACAAGGCD